MAMDTLLNVPEMLFIISVNIYMVGIVYVNILALLNNFSKKKKEERYLPWLLLILLIL